MSVAPPRPPPEEDPLSSPAPEATPRFSLYEVVDVLTSFRTNHERYKHFRVSFSIIRFLSILNFVYTILGVTFLMLALCGGGGGSEQGWAPIHDSQRKQFFRIGLAVSIFAPLASFVDLLALRGLQLWRRSFLLPWLFLYAFTVSLLFANSLAGVFHYGIKWTYMVLMFCALCLYSAWRHVRRQYVDMAQERPLPRTIGDLAGEIRNAQQQQEHQQQQSDLPPKYEDLEQPPGYAEVQQPAKNQAVTEQ